MSIGRVLSRLLCAAICWSPALPGAAQDRPAEALWALLREGGRVVLLRYAETTLGIGDPPGFRIGDCATQRNLSEAGRLNAAQIGVAFRDQRVPIAAVLSSRWCRCLDTAHLAFDRVTPWPALDDLFGAAEIERERRTAALRERLAPPAGGGNLMLVTHDENIRHLTGITPAPGEAVILTPGPGGFTLEGRLPPSAWLRRGG